MRIRHVMKRLVSALLLCCSFLLFAGLHAYAASWDQCKGCHDGVFAPDANAFKQKYKTADDFIRAAKESNEPLMKRYKNNGELLREAAKDIGLK